MTKRRTSIRTLVGTVAAAMLGVIGVSAAPTAAGAAPPPRQLTVMSYNIHAGAGADNVYDLDRIADVIADSGARVVALQEVDRHWGARSNFDDVAAELGSRLRMRVFMAPIYSNEPTEPGGPRAEYGVAILSTYPILAATNHEITRLSTQDPDPVPAPAPGFAEVEINVRGEQVHVYSTHLDYRGDPTVRELQVADTLEIMAADNGPKILMGDMNAAPDAPELAPLQAAYPDAWPVAGQGPGETYPAEVPTARIDQILVSDQVTPLQAWVPESVASDHRPVVARVAIDR